MILRPEGLLGERELFRRSRPASAPKGPQPNSGGASSGRLEIAERRGGRMSQLELADVTKSFGGIKAVTQRRLQVPEGSIFGLIGPNGAGKTTVFNLVTGVYRPTAGSIRMDGLRTRGEARADRAPRASRARSRTSACSARCRCSTTCSSPARRSAARAFAARSRARRRSARKSSSSTTRRSSCSTSSSSARLADERVDLALVRQPAPPRDRARDDAQPKLLLLDEPAAGMNYGEAEGLKKQIRWLRERFELTVVLVEHNMQVVMGVCEAIHVLDHGETIAARQARTKSASTPRCSRPTSA